MTWGLIGSRMQQQFKTQFSFQENLCLQLSFWQLSFWPPFRPPLRTLLFLGIRHNGYILCSSLTPIQRRFYFHIDWSLSFRYYGMGKGGQKGKGKRDERPERDSDLDRRFNAPTSATSHNVNAVLVMPVVLSQEDHRALGRLLVTSALYWDVWKVSLLDFQA